MNTDSICNAIVEVADAIILPRFRSLADSEVDEKRPGDPVTIADLEAEVELTRILSAAFPDAVIVGEEATFVRPELESGLAAIEHAFVVDPVDGTRNFANGSPDFAVMVAEIVAGVTERAWIWQPIHDRMFVSERGAGVWVNGERLAPFAPLELPVEGAIYRVPELQGQDVLFQRTAGSCGIDYPRLLLRKRDFLVYRTLHPWDHLPGVAMVTELGGCAKLLDGTDYGPRIIGKDQLVVAPHEWIVPAVREVLNLG